MRPSSVEQLARIAAAQDGAVAIEQVEALAAVSAKVRRAVVASGWLQAAAPGVLVVAGSPDTWRRRLRIGLLAMGEEA